MQIQLVGSKTLPSNNLNALLPAYYRQNEHQFLPTGSSDLLVKVLPAVFFADYELIFHQALITRALSKSKFALPNMERLIFFSRFTWPSTGPLLHGCEMAFSTAARSR